MKKQRVLVIEPFGARWLRELAYCMQPSFDVHFFSFNTEGHQYDGLQLNEVALDYSKRLLEVIRQVQPDGIFVSFEFCWRVFLTPEFVIPFDPDKVIALLWDDVVYHDANIKTLRTLGLRRVCIGDKIGELKYLEQGFDAIFTPLEGSHEIYKYDPARSRLTDIAFFGLIEKADRRTFIEKIGAAHTITMTSESICDPSKPPLTYPQLSEKIQDSKIILNFSKSDPDHGGGFKYQLKGRVLESLFCGAIPVTEFCPNSALLFDDLIPQFRNPEQAIEILGSLINTPSTLADLQYVLTSMAEKYRPSSIYSRIRF